MVEAFGAVQSGGVDVGVAEVLLALARYVGRLFDDGLIELRRQVRGRLLMYSVSHGTAVSQRGASW